MAGHDPSHRRDIDGLRAIAIILVVAFHAGLDSLSGGFVGVDVFFVISGYLITLLMLREAEKTGGVSLTDFYARRTRRLLPALCVVVLVSLVGGALILPPSGDQQDLAKSALAAATFSSNFYFWLTSGGYFDGPSELKPFLNMWSLAVEEQFYLVWPLMMIAMIRFAGTGRRLRSTLVIALSVIFVASLALCIHWTKTKTSAAFYLMPTRAWEFAIGALLAVGHRHVARLPSKIAGPLALLGVAAIVWSGFAFDSHTAFPGVAAMVPTLGTGMIIAAGTAAPSSLTARALGSWPMVQIGLVSYSWYLWHWPMLALARAAQLGEHNPARDVTVALASLVLAYATYRLVENPIRFGKPGPFKTPRGAIAAGAGITVGLMAGGVALGGIARMEARSNAIYDQAYTARHDFPALWDACAEAYPYGGNLKPALKCTVGRKEGPVNLVLWGDSHAGQFEPLLERFSETSQLRTLQRAMTSCPPLQNVVPVLGEKPVIGCDLFNRQVAAEVKELSASGELRGVVLAARWPRYMLQKSITITEDEEAGNLDSSLSSHEQAMERMEKELRENLAFLSSLDVRVLVIAPVPELRYMAPFCLVRREADECAVSRAQVEEHRADSVHLLNGVVAAFPNARVWDPIDFVCDAQTCYAQRNSKILYRDDDHITTATAYAMTDFARVPLEWVAGLSSSEPAVTENSTARGLMARPSTKAPPEPRK